MTMSKSSVSKLVPRVPGVPGASRRQQYSASTKRALVDVACEAGFADQAHFTRVFRSAFGLTPARYRALRIRPLDLTGPRAVQ